jgi:protocatechuate 3,4-dioxygenase beta subunit
MMDNDDLPIGRILTRREAISLLAVSSATVLVGCKSGDQDEDAATPAAELNAATNALLPACVVRPELTEGPYFLDQQLNRSDIRLEPSTGKASAGVPIVLAFSVSRIANGSCAPLEGALVDVWQCDAAGVYSGVSDPNFGRDVAGLKFLRGYQHTDKSGKAQFTTIYPGWYSGRTVHIHFKIRAPQSAQGATANSVYEFTSQLFFDDTLTDRVFRQAPYAAKGERNVRNRQDGIFREAGDQLVLKMNEQEGGFAAAFDVGLDFSDTRTGQPDGMGNRGSRGGRRGAPPPPTRTVDG